MATPFQRNHLHGLMMWLVLHEELILYKQDRPMKSQHLFERDLVALFAAKKTFAMDCSESVTMMCRMAGLKDPNGLNYNGAGYTGTLLKHLPHYSDPKDADVGALVVFGPGDGDHVCQVAVAGKDPMLFSHGQNKGPVLIRLSDERKYQKPPVTFLSIAKL